jgi:hypothetical protein
LANGVASQYWNIDACTSVVTFSYYSPGSKAGTYSFSSTGTGTPAAGSFTQLVSGATPSDTWTYVEDWDNQDIQFNPAALNVYAIDFRWLGAGIVRFFMEDPASGHLTLVHTQHWTRDQTGVYPHINKPSLRITYRAGATNGSSPAQNVSVRGASLFAGLQGTLTQTVSSQGYFNLDPSSRAKDTVWHLLSIQNPYVRNGSLNKSSILMQELTVAVKSTDPSVVYIVKNSVGTSDLLVFNSVPPVSNPFVFAQYSVSAVSETLASDSLLSVQTVSPGGSSQFDLTKYNLSLAPGDYISVFISSTTSINTTSVGMTWLID